MIYLLAYYNIFQQYSIENNIIIHGIYLHNMDLFHFLFLTGTISKINELKAKKHFHLFIASVFLF